MDKVKLGGTRTKERVTGAGQGGGEVEGEILPNVGIALRGRVTFLKERKTYFITTQMTIFYAKTKH